MLQKNTVFLQPGLDLLQTRMCASGQKYPVRSRDHETAIPLESFLADPRLGDLLIGGGFDGIAIKRGKIRDAGSHAERPE